MKLLAFANLIGGISSDYMHLDFTVHTSKAPSLYPSNYRVTHSIPSLSQTAKHII